MSGKQITVIIITLLAAGLAGYAFLPADAPVPSPAPAEKVASPTPAENADRYWKALSSRSEDLEAYATRKGYSTEVAFLVDLKLPSGKKRFFVYDLSNDSVLHAGLVAHGSCNASLADAAAYSNTVGSGCSSPGRYKVGNPYNGNFGKAFKLHGLDSSNSNAFERYVVLHAYGCVPDEETFPELICTSLGCPMVSYHFLDTLSTYIGKTEKPILLWVMPE